MNLRISTKQKNLETTAWNQHQATGRTPTEIWFNQNQV